MHVFIYISRIIPVACCLLALFICHPASAQYYHHKKPYASGSQGYHQYNPSRNATDNYMPWDENQASVEPANIPPGHKLVHISSGTGFFVSNRGHIVTNEHVVKGCQEVKIRGAVEPSTAEVIDTDENNDLALLKTQSHPRRVATVRTSGDRIKVGDPVLVMGYPRDHGRTGEYKVVESTIIDIEGPLEEPHWIQFNDSAEQGNSGGPLLDSSGHVVGVVVGKAKLIEYDRRAAREKVVKKADLAISLPVMKRFLHRNGVYFRSATSHGYYSMGRVENQAKSYIVNIHCVNGNQVVSR